MAKKILIVDDEADFLDVMKIRINGWGYDCLGASSGQEALETLSKHKIDVVILDYIMPHMDGLATLKEIRKVNKDMPVVMLTAHPDKKVIKGSEKQGVVVFIPKVSAYQDMHDALKTALDMVLKKGNKA